jgi:Fe-Mn family superoxide dismutase
MFTEKSFTLKPLQGIGTESIAEHIKLYSGYVKNANTVQEKIAALALAETPAYELGELYRRFSFEYNGMRNHEIYFSLLLGIDEGTAPMLCAQIEKQWGSIDAWKQAMTNLALTRGIGWAMTSYDNMTNSLILHWVDEQHLGQLQGTHAIVVLDMWEHSFVFDYQPSGKKKYVEDFLSQINWAVAEQYFVSATKTI